MGYRFFYRIYLKLFFSCFFIIVFSSHIVATVYPYLEVPEPGIIYALQSMRAHQIQMTMFMNYTMNMDTPGYVETGAYNIRTKDGEIMAAPFYRWRTGPPVETNRDLDFYCFSKGHGFFTFRMPGGNVGYSRDGCFEMDSNNRLVSLSHEFPVLSPSGEDIYLPDGKVSASSSGVIFVDGEPIDKLAISVFTDESRNNLVSLNGTFFVYNGGEPELLEGPEYYSIKQFFMEQNSVLKSLVGDVALSKYPYEASAKLARQLTKSMTSAVQLANP
jgi:flagellar basal body rod protein FlgG